MTDKSTRNVSQNSASLVNNMSGSRQMLRAQARNFARDANQILDVLYKGTDFASDASMQNNSMSV
ncbi:MAG: hypothetical protein P1U34_06490 [Coxiellaceae bacterium]|nr:hypothetical protein [Coxiellaceae bacterium]